MSTATEPKFACAACGRQYAWKPELAGKKGKCKCGAPMDIPATVEGAENIGKPPPVARAVSRQSSTSRPEGEISLNDLAALAKGEIKDDNAYKCPWCGTALEGKNVICSNCKMNIKTGQKHDPKKAAAIAAKKKEAEKKKNPNAGGESPAKQLGGVIVVIILLAITGLRIYRTFNKDSNTFSGDDSSSSAAAPAALDRDATALEMMRDMEPIEAREYINANTARSLSAQWTNNQSKARIEGWYNEYKPKKIVAFNALISQQVIFELPDDPELRGKALAWGTQWQKDRAAVPPGKDVGQKYMIIDTN